jgi:KaiC/GvpD/RAD55 family RecA-like ATPase
VPRLSLIEDLTSGGIHPGFPLLVVYDPSSLWYNALFTIAAGWLESGGDVYMDVTNRPVDDVRLQLNRLRVNVEELEAKNRLVLWDYYSVTLGRKSKERYAPDSMKVADLSIMMSTQFMRGLQFPERLVITDVSILDRYNDEKSWLEFLITRDIAATRLCKNLTLYCVARGIHSESAYKRLEVAVDGVIDFKLDETGEETRSFMRIRSMRDLGFDSRWHQLNIVNDFGVTLKK